jgi:hypothetical protein
MNEINPLDEENKKNTLQWIKDHIGVYIGWSGRPEGDDRQDKDSPSEEVKKNTILGITFKWKF